MPHFPSAEATTSASFTQIPTLSLASALFANTKPAFLTSLRAALLRTGFLYLTDTGLPVDLINDVTEQTRLFFESLPEEEKLRIEMKNEKSFLGYSRLGNEITAGEQDWREQLDLSTPQPLPAPGSPLWYNLLAPNQWPSSKHLPRFREIFESYMSHMSRISTVFTSLVSEALGLPSDAFDRFFDANQHHKLKLVKYPDLSNLSCASNQGVGPHKDSMLTSYLLQASHHRGLQAQNTAGEWIDCPPIDDTLVVVIGQGLEALTGGICTSTTHRVLSPEKGSGPRYSVPFFQGVSYDAKFEDLTDDIPEEVRQEKDQLVAAQGGRRDDVEFTFVKGRWKSLGEATLMNRIKSHQDVGERWYPELLAQIRNQQARDAQAKSGSLERAVIETDGNQRGIEAH